MKKLYYLLFSILVLGTLIVPQNLLAGHHGGGNDHPSVQPILVPGNPKCADLEYCECSTSFKPQPEPPSTGSYTNPDDPNMTVEIESDGTYFSWESTRPVCCVIVKGGPNANVYVYDPKSTGDSNLRPPTNSHNHKPYTISHIEFCYDRGQQQTWELNVIKTAETEYTRTFNWTISKTASPTEHEMCPGERGVTSKYAICVDKTGYVDSGWMVTGTITITNPNRANATITGISDVIDGIPATISGVTLPHELGNGETLEVTYSANLPDGSNRVNTVLVTTSGQIEGNTATADVIFNGPTNIVNNTIHVDDSNGMSWEFEDDGCVNYCKMFTEPGEYKNTATIRETMQQCEPATASATVIVTMVEPPEADFSAEPVYGIAPMEVCFTDLSVRACEWLWDFGDGTTSTEKDPCHVYYGDQKYITVTLKAMNCAGEDVAVKTNYITVNRPSEVNFEAAPLAGLAGLEVNFVNNFGGNANHHLWTYGDGTSEEFTHDSKNRVNPSHVYAEAGEYNVTLKSWGNGGEAELTLPGLVYVDENFDYLNLLLVDAGATAAGEGWENAIDHDIFGSGSNVAAVASDAWAVFMFADSAKYDIHKLRLLVDTIEPGNLTTNLTQDFEVWVSDDGVNFVEGFKGVITKKDGVWETFELEDAVTAKYLKVVLASARGENAAYRELVELQFFGEKNVFGMAKGNSINFESEAAPTSYKLEQNYPNPFNPETYIAYELPENSYVKLEIYNIQGKLIETLVNGQMAAGSHRALWNGQSGSNGSVGSGIYIYRLQAISENGQAISFTRKMTLMK